MFGLVTSSERKLYCSSIQRIVFFKLCGSRLRCDGHKYYDIYSYVFCKHLNIHDFTGNALLLFFLKALQLHHTCLHQTASLFHHKPTKKTKRQTFRAQLLSKDPRRSVRIKKNIYTRHLWAYQLPSSVLIKQTESEAKCVKKC